MRGSRQPVVGTRCDAGGRLDDGGIGDHGDAHALEWLCVRCGTGGEHRKRQRPDRLVRSEHGAVVDPRLALDLHGALQRIGEADEAIDDDGIRASANADRAAVLHSLCVQ